MPHGVNHIYSCDTKELNKQEIRFQLLKYNFPKICEKEYLEQKYVNESKSLPDIRSEYGISFKSIIFLLDYYGIKNRTQSDGVNMNSTKIKYKETCIKNYGVDNVSKCEKIKDKKRLTFTKNYGVDNIWKSKEYYTWLHDYMLKTYGKKSLPNKYGNMNKYYDNMSEYDKIHKMDKDHLGYIEFWKNLSDEQKDELIIKKTMHFTMTGFYSSKLETKISDCLDKLTISHTKGFYIGRKIYDKISNSNIIIEVNGDFWHGNPLFYKEDDVINHPFQCVIAKNLWIKDEKKKIIAENKSYLYMGK